MKKKHKIAELIQKIPILKSNQHYRVGDIINRMGLGRSENSRVHILNDKEFKGSILQLYLDQISTDSFKAIPLKAAKSYKSLHPFAGKFIDSSKERDYRLLASIVKKVGPKYPLPAPNELCIHLRGGDVLSLNTQEKSALRGKEKLHLLADNQKNLTLLDSIRQKLTEPTAEITSITFVTAIHFGDHPWSGAFKYTNKKLKINLELYTRLFSSVIQEFSNLKITLPPVINSQSHEQTDYHLSYLCHASHIITDAGGFSKQAGLIRNELL